MEYKELERPGVSAVTNLPDYVADVIAALKTEKKYPAARNHLSVLRSITRFAESRGDVSLPMQTVFTHEWLKAYEEWLTMRKLDPNTVSTYLRTLQAVYHRWMPLGSMGYDPLLFKEIFTRVEASTKRALTVQQMERLLSTDFAILPGEQRSVLACFLLMFMLRGMPFIDLVHLQKTDLRNGRIVYRRHKTGKMMVVDVPPEALRLLRTYRDRTDSAYLLPLLNADISDDEALYHCYQMILRRFNRELAKVMKVLLPGVKVSSYTARHTWATIAYHMGVSVGLISQSLGHSSIQVTMAYLKPFDAEVVDKLNRQVISFVRKCKKQKKRSCSTLYDTM